MRAWRWCTVPFPRMGYQKWQGLEPYECDANAREDKMLFCARVVYGISHSGSVRIVSNGRRMRFRSMENGSVGRPM